MVHIVGLQHCGKQNDKSEQRARVQDSHPKSFCTVIPSLRDQTNKCNIRSRPDKKQQSSNWLVHPTNFVELGTAAAQHWICYWLCVVAQGLVVVVVIVVVAGALHDRHTRTIGGAPGGAPGTSPVPQHSYLSFPVPLNLFSYSGSPTRANRA